MDNLGQKRTKILEKNENEYSCIFCNFITSKKTDYNIHLMTAKHIKNEKKTKILEKNENEYSCIFCNFITSKKTDYNIHLTTAKHIKNEKRPKNETEYSCDYCNFITKNKTKYHYHISTKKHLKNINTKEQSLDNMVIIKDIFCSLIKDNQEFKQMMIKQNEQMIELSNKNNSIIQTNNTINNTMNNTMNNTINNNNHKFNLNFFLNEQCKDAMNLSEFVDTIDVTLQDLEYVGEHGYVNGITKIIMDNLNQLDLYKRPIHCTDIKREIIHIKDNNKWEKDKNNEKIKDFIALIGNKNGKLVGIWQIENPEYTILDSPKYNQWINLAMRSNEYSKEKQNHEAILRNIVKRIYIDKNQIITV